LRAADDPRSRGDARRNQRSGSKQNALIHRHLRARHGLIRPLSTARTTWLRSPRQCSATASATEDQFIRRDDASELTASSLTRKGAEN
jgi:hypothetical protein